MSATWHADMLVAVQTEVLAQVDAAGAGAYVNIRDASDNLLSTLPLDFPSGTVNETTGQLTIEWGARDEEAAAGGTASYGELCDAADKIWMTAPFQAGGTPVSGYFTMPSLTIVVGAPVEGVTLTIG